MKLLSKIPLLFSAALYATCSTSGYGISLEDTFKFMEPHVTYCKDRISNFSDSLPAPLYATLDEAYNTLSTPCVGEDCERWAKNGNGKRLPDHILYLLKDTISTFYREQNLNLFQWNIFFYRLTMLLSAYPQKKSNHWGISSSSNACILNFADGGPTAATSQFFLRGYNFCDLLNEQKAPLPQLNAIMDDIYNYQNNTIHFFQNRLFTHPGYPHHFNHFFDAQYFSNHPTEPIVFSLWDTALTIQDLNKAAYLDLYPMAAIPDMIVTFDSRSAPPCDFFAHDFVHFLDDMANPNRMLLLQIYKKMNTEPLAQQLQETTPLEDKLHHYTAGEKAAFFSLRSVFEFFIFELQHEANSASPSVRADLIKGCEYEDKTAIFDLIEANYIPKRFYNYLIESHYVTEKHPTQKTAWVDGIEDICRIMRPSFRHFEAIFEAELNQAKNEEWADY